MKLSNETVKILKSFSSINPSIVFKPGSVLATMAPSKSIMARAKIDEEIPSQFAIWDLSRFLGTLSLFNDPDIELKDNNLEIREGKKKISYVFTEPSLIVSPPSKEVNMPSAEVSFVLEANVLTELQKALSVLSLPEFSVMGDGDKIFVRAIDSKNPTGDTFAVEVGDTNKKFNMIISAENLKLIPGSYDVEISSKGLSHFKNDKIEYYVSVEQNSSYEG